jgi:hypothetical protein
MLSVLFRALSPFPLYIKNSDVYIKEREKKMRETQYFFSLSKIIDSYTCHKVHYRARLGEIVEKMRKSCIPKNSKSQIDE